MDIVRQRLAEGDAARKRGPMGTFADAMHEQMTGERPPPVIAPHVVPPPQGPVKTTVTGAPDVKLKNDRLPPLHPQDRSIFQKIADFFAGQPPPGVLAGVPGGQLPHGAEGVRHANAHVQALAQSAVAYFQSRGWTHEQAAGIAANLQYESNFNPHGPAGDGGLARGIAQWHPDRQADFARHFGHDLSQSTLQEQLAFVDWELKQGQLRLQAAGARLRNARTAREAGAIVSRGYEAPAAGDLNADIRGNLAEQIARMKPDAPQPAGTRSVTINAPTTVTATGTTPNETAKAVGREIGRRNADLTRANQNYAQ